VDQPALLLAGDATLVRANRAFCEYVGIPESALQKHAWLSALGGSADDWARLFAASEPPTATLRLGQGARSCEAVVAPVAPGLWLALLCVPVQSAREGASTSDVL